MFKQLTTGFALMISAAIFSQVGIGTENPQATLDVMGKPSETTELDGIIAPRITGVQLRAKTYTEGQTGALVYVTEADTAPDGQTEDVTSAGYYYFDGTKWIPSGGYNIYNSDGSLTGNGTTRKLTLNGKGLRYIGTDEMTSWASFGTIFQTNLQSGTGSAGVALRGGNDSNMDIQQFYNGAAQISAGRNATSLSLSTHMTNASAPITFSTSAGSIASATEKMRITGEGNVGINSLTPTERLHVNGNVRLQGLPLNGSANAIYTTPGGTESPAQNQTFTATRTVVADANGVLGYMEGLPSSDPGNSGTINVGETISRIYSVPNATATANTFNLNTYVTINSLPALPVIDGLQINLQGVNGNYYDPRIYNVSSASLLLSYQSFATQVNQNRTLLNNTVAAGGNLQVDQDNLVFWTTSAAEVETTNIQVQIDADTYRWYEFKWWCMEVSGEKKIFLSVNRKA